MISAPYLERLRGLAEDLGAVDEIQALQGQVREELEVRYAKVAWNHDFTDEPVLYLSELGDDGYETRKVQFYRDGRAEWADQSYETATVGLSEIPFPALEEISSQPEFDAELIDSKEFEQAWIRARTSS